MISYCTPKYKKRLLIRKINAIIYYLFGLFTTGIALLCLVIILGSILKNGASAFFTHSISLDIKISAKTLNQIKQKSNNYNENLELLIEDSFNDLANKFKKDYVIKEDILTSNSVITLQNYLTKHINHIKENSIIKLSFLTNSDVDIYLKNTKANKNNLNSDIANFVSILKKQGIIYKHFNISFFTNNDSGYAEQAGIKGAIIGSITTIFLTLIFSFVISICTAIYLEEFAPKNKFISLIEININNLAAVPSIIFGLLGLIVFQHFFGVPRSSPLLASLVLTLMTLPTMITSSKIALVSVPNSIKEAAYGIGASKNQVVFTHIVPLALPGILTGVIIGISRAIGETAPLLMIGMVAFITTAKFNILTPSTALPVQILLWSDLPGAGYTEKASAAIIVLLVILITINAITSYLRKKFEKVF